MHALSSKSIEAIESSIGYTFRRKDLLMEALTHKSFANENPEYASSFNERLEFLGDAVLELIVSEYIFRSYPEYTEADLSKIKSYAVQENTLAEAATELNIGSYMLLGKGEEATGGREKPSLLANTFEAILAAIYLDGGLKDAERFVLSSLKPRIDRLVSDGLIFDFKTVFQEMVQERYGVLPKYVIHREEGPEHKKTFEVRVFVKKDLYGAGRGRTKKEAAQRAAEMAVRRLRDIQWEGQ